jgi:2-polyprenyl-3-methyl-5-hydroxy-6-metoxy-1,4-benzoquinol methylase
MISDKEFLKTEIEMGISLDNPAFKALAFHTAEQLDIPITSVLDYGAGTGVYADAFSKKYKTFAFEIWDAHKDYIRENLPSLEIVDKPITTDLMLFIEVAEHMKDSEIKKLFKSINPNYILFSSTSQTTSWDDDWGHINIKQQDEWIIFFAKLGYTLSKNLEYPTQYSKLFIYDKTI